MDIKKMMQQAQELQKKMQKLQDDLESVEVSGSAGGAGYVVEVTMTGKGVVKRVSISDSLIDLEEKTTLEDLIVAATNNAKTKMDGVVAAKMAELGIPSGLLG